MRPKLEGHEGAGGPGRARRTWASTGRAERAWSDTGPGASCRAGPCRAGRGRVHERGGRAGPGERDGRAERERAGPRERGPGRARAGGKASHRLTRAGPAPRGAKAERAGRVRPSTRGNSKGRAGGRKMSCRERSTSPVLHGQPFRVNGTYEQMDKIWMRCWHKCVTLLCVFVLG